MNYRGMTIWRTVLGLVLLVLAGNAAAQTRATYLANEGVMIQRGDTTILFDPLFDNGFGQYQLLPDDMSAALFAGEAPFNDVDAVIISHAHADHFTPALMLRYLRAQPEVDVYAPAQAVAALREIAADSDVNLLDRVTGLALEVGDASLNFSLDGVAISAVRIPHSGWPTRRTDIENLVFRITLDNDTSILHFGDAAVSSELFAAQSQFWDEQSISLALPPYWFFQSAEGNDILRSTLAAERAIGVHVPAAVPNSADERAAEFRGVDLFTEPGEFRELDD